MLICANKISYKSVLRIINLIKFRLILLYILRFPINLDYLLSTDSLDSLLKEAEDIGKETAKISSTLKDEIKDP